MEVEDINQTPLISREGDRETKKRGGGERERESVCVCVNVCFAEGEGGGRRGDSMYVNGRNSSVGYF